MNARKLKSIRVDHGYTQETLSREIPITTKTYNRKELGVVPFNIEEIKKISEIFNLTLDQVNLIFFDNELTNCINKVS